MGERRERGEREERERERGEREGERERRERVFPNLERSTLSQYIGQSFNFSHG